MDINEIITTLYILPEPSKAALIATAKHVAYPKGYILLKADRIEKHIYFIKKGAVRAYSDAPGGQVTFWFGLEGAPVLSMKSYITGEKSYENIAALKALYEKDIHLANWGRKLAEHELVKTEERLIAMQFKTAQERYMDLIESQPALLLRVQLGHIASYLGMSQVSLSRIRADLK